MPLKKIEERRKRGNFRMLGFCFFLRENEKLKTEEEIKKMCACVCVYVFFFFVISNYYFSDFSASDSRRLML
jgi:hypothetical protein